MPISIISTLYSCKSNILKVYDMMGNFSKMLVGSHDILEGNTMFSLKHFLIKTTLLVEFI